MARKILLADDSVTAQNMGRKILTDAGYEVITVNNGSAALKRISESKPDLIVLDVYMPGYSGLEVCQRLKETHETARIPVLLTVGKLEPFKPEEAKRARAEAFIVKPFEASELLSTLTKLEDKIVPRAEGSKPGRFARANAALDEGRYDKTVGIDEDSGWKDRIAFPSKKKKEKEREKAVEADDGDDPALYNAVNRDLRTTVERHGDQRPQDTKANQDRAEEARVDLGALAPEGLPKDVTAEEIAALAAAAAQVKAKFGDDVEGKIEESAPQPAVAAGETRAEAGTGEKVEVKTDSKQEPQAQEVAASEAAVATFAEQKSESGQKAEEEKPEEKVETPVAPRAEAEAEAVGLAAPDTASPAEPAPAFSSTNAGDEAGAQGLAAPPAGEPFTMAAAAGAGNGASSSRWTAVAVALAPEEAAISLELEMQKAHAAFAAAEAAKTGSVVIIPEPATAPEPPALESAPVTTSAVAELAAEPGVASQAVPESAASDGGSYSPEAIAKVREFESVASSRSAEAPAEAAESPFTPAQFVEPAIPSAPERETFVEEIPAAQRVAAEPEIAQEATQEPPQREQETPQPAEKQEAIEETRPEEPMRAEEVVAAASEVVAGVSASTQAGPEATGHAEKPETDVAETTTAAAWATWRRIRESGDSTGQSHAAQGNGGTDQSGASAPSQAEAATAMAAAAGAEGPAQDAAQDSDSPEIASIVDSVLADLRPKIVAEISKKLGKKKQ